MKILHICLGAFFPDGYSYQENMLPKFHKRMGFDVEVIASLVTFDGNGKITYYEKPSSYYNEYNILVKRLKYKEPTIVYKTMRRFQGFKEELWKSNPDIIFIHNCQFMDIDLVAEYAKRKKVTIFVDNHADYSNSARNILSKYILHRCIWRRCANLIEPYTTRFYGVLPARVDFLREMYGLPNEKCKLLVMGADDDLINKASRYDSIKAIRNKFNILDDDFLIVSGGKIDFFKTQTLLLMQAVKEIPNAKIRLIVFGSVINELKAKFFDLVDGDRVQYAGWVDSKDSYTYFAAAQLVVFPGRHSVFWEQTVAQGIPMICKYWKGTTHVDVGGNVKFLYEDSVSAIRYEIENLISNSNELNKMREVAIKKGKRSFSYNDIARKSITI